jgi:hypothetical protein
VARKYWTCPCGTRNDRAGGRRKCVNPDCDLRRAKTRRPKHKEIMRGDTYPLFVQAAREIHGVSDESCCVCGKPRRQEGNWDRDHDHKTGKARGLACSGNQGCNVLMLPWITAATAFGIAQAKLEAGEPDAERWGMIAMYLERVEVFYAREAVTVNG